MSALEPEDLAYMRGTQAEVWPTAATVHRPGARTPDGLGGYTTASGSPEPIRCRIARVADNTSSDDVPADLAGRYQASDLARITAPLFPPLAPGALVRDDDTGRWWEVVSDGTAEAWATAQRVWAAQSNGPD